MAASAALAAALPARAAQEGSPAPATPADLDPRSLALAREIIDISYPQAVRAGLLTRSVRGLAENVRASVTETLGDRVDDEVNQIMNRYFDRMRDLADGVVAQHSPALYEAYARSYARGFTYDELVQVRAFAATPAGARFLQRAGNMISDPDIARATTAFGSAFATAMEPAQREFDEALRAYVERRNRAQPH
jgi:hypothetical protein